MEWFESANEYLAEWKARDAAWHREFTAGALRGLELARREAVRMNRNYIGTEHILLGLTRLAPDSPNNLLRKLGLDLELIQSEVERVAGVGREKYGQDSLPHTPRATTVIETAKQDAKVLGRSRVTPGHLLSGLLKETGGSTAAVFKNLKLDREELRRRVLEELKPSSGNDEPKGTES
jgi:ATP-dependent Clp protease ATP-binding subunit ClpC